MAAGDRAGGAARAADADDDGFVVVLRFVSARAAAGVADAGAARLLRCAHVSARRSRGHVSHAVDMSLEKIAAELRHVALSYPETYEEQPWGHRVANCSGKIFFTC